MHLRDFYGPRLIDLRRGRTAGARGIQALSDSNKQYLSTDLLREEPVREDDVSTEAELTSSSALACVGSGCIDF